MPRRCSVPGCKTNSNWKLNGKCETTFSFPKDEFIQRKWIRNIPGMNWSPSKRYAVCYKHFKNIDIIRCDRHKQADGTYKNIRLLCPRLKPSAVPCIFSNYSSYTDTEDRRDNVLQHPSEQNDVLVPSSRHVEMTLASQQSVEIIPFSKFPKETEDQINCSSVQAEDEDIFMEFADSGNAEISLNQEDITEDPLNQECDGSTCETTTVDLNSTEPNVLDFVKVELCENPLDIPEEDIPQCTDPLGKTSEVKFEDDFLQLVRIEDCSKPAKPRKRRKQLLLPRKRKNVRLIQPKKSEPVDLEVKIEQLNGLNTSAPHFEVNAQPTVVEEDGFCQKVVLEIKVKPRKQPKVGRDVVSGPSVAVKHSVQELKERIQNFLHADIKKSNRIERLQKVVQAQKKEIDELTKIVDDIMDGSHLEQDNGSQNE